MNLDPVLVGMLIGTGMLIGVGLFVAIRWLWRNDWRQTAVLIGVSVIVGCALIIAVTAVAQEPVLMHGVDPSGNIRQMLTDSSGNVLTGSIGSSGGTHAACTETQMTIGATALATPPTALSNRTSIAIQMRTSGQTLTCRLGGGTPTSLGAGIDLGNFDILRDNLSPTVVARCICSAAGCTVNVVECP